MKSLKIKRGVRRSLLRLRLKLVLMTSQITRLMMKPRMKSSPRINRKKVVTSQARGVNRIASRKLRIQKLRVRPQSEKGMFL